MLDMQIGEISDMVILSLLTKSFIVFVLSDTSPVLPRYFTGTSRAGLFFMVGIIVGIMIGLGEILVRYLVVTWSVPGRYLVGTWSLLGR
jgi:uncharacterized ion transporter superfamily protein YfcC